MIEQHVVEFLGAALDGGIEHEHDLDQLGCEVWILDVVTTTDEHND